MNLVREAFDILRQHRKLYFILCGVYYGLVLLASIYSYFDRAPHNMMLEALGMATSSGGPLAPVLDAYESGRIVSAVALTFGINVAVGSFVSITLPSLIIPFSGLTIAVYRATLWGILYSPEPGVALTGQNIAFGVFAVGLLFLEGQGYILTSVAAVLQGRGLLSPKSLGQETRWGGYLAGLKLTGKVYILVVAVLFIAAIYEVMSVLLFPR